MLRLRLWGAEWRCLGKMQVENLITKCLLALSELSVRLITTRNGGVAQFSKRGI